MNTQLLGELIDSGYADDAGLAADVVNADGVRYYLCVSGEIVTLVSVDMKKVFSDSIDKLSDLNVSGLFGKKICFSHCGTDYALKVKGGKTLVDYFKLIG